MSGMKHGSTRAEMETEVKKTMFVLEHVGDLEALAGE
jgi:hypothetical protein